MPVEQKLTFNPEKRRQGVPENIPDHPIGTKEEAEELGLDPSVYATCSKPVKGINRGCEFFNICPLSYKGKTFAEGGGPRCHGFEVAMPGKPIRRWQDVCFSMVPRISDIEDNRGAVRVIADEGETYEKVEGIYIKTFIDPETDEQVRVPAREGEYHYPNVQRGDMLVEKLVLPYERPSQNQELAADLITANVVAKEQERIRGEAFPSALGIEVGGTPLDKRNRRSRKSADKSE